MYASMESISTRTSRREDAKSICRIPPTLHRLKLTNISILSPMCIESRQASDLRSSKGSRKSFEMSDVLNTLSESEPLYAHETQPSKSSSLAHNWILDERNCRTRSSCCVCAKELMASMRQRAALSFFHTRHGVAERLCATCDNQQRKIIFTGNLDASRP